MTVEQLLTPLILQEFEKYERQGQKIKLKSSAKRRIKYTVICLLVAIFFLFAAGAWPISVIVLIVYIVLMKKVNNISTILYVAKKSPDTPIDMIIAQEIKSK